MRIVYRMSQGITQIEGDLPGHNQPWHYDAVGKDSKGRVYRKLFGHWWGDHWNSSWDDRGKGMNLLEIHLYCFLEPAEPEEGGLSKFEHGKRAVDLIWNADPENPNFVWTPECIKMMEEACENKYLGICGAASCGKSHFAAMWGLLCFYAAPSETMVLVTSTSLTAAKQRVWGSVQRLWSNMPEGLRKMAKMVGSNGVLRYKEVDESKAQTDTRGITLVAAEQKNDKEAVAKLIGRKMRRMLLLCDELPEISPSVVTAAKGNLATNPFFQFIALGNPKSFLDAFGNFCKPLNGWESINELSYEWPIRSGKVIRFDATKSTNFVTGKWVYEFMPSKEVIEEAREEFGENSLTFYRMYRGFFPPQGSTDAVFPALDLVLFNQKSVDWGKEGFTKVAGLDVGFTTDGDKTVLTVLKVGRDKSGASMVEFHKAYTIKENIMQKDEARSFQICNKAKEILESEGIPFKYLAYDSTGGGAPFGDILSVVLKSRDIMGVCFSESASERKGAGTDKRPANERYANKRSEIIYQVSGFLRGKQIAGLPDELMQEMSYLQYTTGQRGKVSVMPKKDIKAITGRSPDDSDSMFLAFEVACAKLHISTRERGELILPEKDYYETLRSLDIVTQGNNGLHEWMPSHAA